MPRLWQHPFLLPASQVFPSATTLRQHAPAWRNLQESTLALTVNKEEKQDCTQKQLRNIYCSLSVVSFMFHFLPDLDICLDQRAKWWSASKFMLATSCILSLLISTFSHTCQSLMLCHISSLRGAQSWDKNLFCWILLHSKGNTQEKLHTAPTGTWELWSFSRDICWQWSSTDFSNYEYLPSYKASEFQVTGVMLILLSISCREVFLYF